MAHLGLPDRDRPLLVGPALKGDVADAVYVTTVSPMVRSGAFGPASTDTLTLGEGHEKADHRRPGRGERRTLGGNRCRAGISVPPDHAARALCGRRSERCDCPTPRSI